jgi:hypothetical protein
MLGALPTFRIALHSYPAETLRFTTVNLKINLNPNMADSQESAGDQFRRLITESGDDPVRLVLDHQNQNTEHPHSEDCKAPTKPIEQTETPYSVTRSIKPGSTSGKKTKSYTESSKQRMD